MQQINVNKGERETVKEMDIVFPLLKWYSQSARTLPWRERPEPYNVWISEIMLQQTRVEAVKPYFERFLKEFPNIGELARAEEDRLLKAWEGLGYYNRVKNMQKAAVLVMEQYGGKLPEEYEELLKLPGIGPYTAGAISSIAYGKVHPAVDGNVLRVMTRLLADDRNILSQKVKNDIGNMLYKIMPKDKPGASSCRVAQSKYTTDLGAGRDKRRGQKTSPGTWGLGVGVEESGSRWQNWQKLLCLFGHHE